MSKVWNWIKSKWKQILIFLGVGVALASTALIFNPNADSILVGTQTITFSYTSGSSGNDLIISTDQQVYVGNGRVPVYIEIKNTTAKDQNVLIGNYFQDTAKFISEIDNLIQVATGTQQVNAWQKIQVQPFSALSYSSLTAKTDFPVLSKNNYVSPNIATDKILAGKSNFYRVVVNFPAGYQGEFFIEAIGDLGGYGLLDPEVQYSTFLATTSPISSLGYPPEIKAQVWSATSSHIMNQICEYAYLNGTPGNCTTSLRATVSYLGSQVPTGSDLVYWAYNGNIFAASPGSRNCGTTNSTYNIVGGTSYAFIYQCSAPALVLLGESPGTYPNGNFAYTNNGSPPWSTSTYSLYFEEWGPTTTIPLYNLKVIIE